MIDVLLVFYFLHNLLSLYKLSEHPIHVHVYMLRTMCTSWAYPGFREGVRAANLGGSGGMLPRENFCIIGCKTTQFEIVSMQLQYTCSKLYEPFCLAFLVSTFMYTYYN
jgi:hypothetical protein